MKRNKVLKKKRFLEGAVKFLADILLSHEGSTNPFTEYVMLRFRTHQRQLLKAEAPFTLANNYPLGALSDLFQVSWRSFKGAYTPGKCQGVNSCTKDF